MPTQIKLPNLGENIESGDVLTIFVSEGDTVTADQDLLEVETDKATMPIPSPQGGKIVKILVSEGDTINVGAAIMEIEGGEGAAKGGDSNGAKTAKKPEAAKTSKKAEAPEAEVEEGDEESPEEKAEKLPKKGAKAAPPADDEGDAADDEEEAPPAAKPKKPTKTAEVDEDESPDDSDVAEEARPVKATRTTHAAAAARSKPEEDTPGDGHAAAAAGPAVRRLARQLGVDLRRVRASGSGGRITAEDVRTYVRQTNEQVAATLPQGVTPPGTADTDDYGAVRVEKMSRLRQTIAKNMLSSLATIPQLTNFDEADVSELEDMRQQSKEDYAARGIKLTSMPFLIKAVASSLKRHPIVNATVDMEANQIIYKEYIHIGIAVDTEKGLLVPVLRDADRKSIAQIANELDEMATDVREGSHKLEDLRGGTFTISNLGSVGGIYSTPIINPPQAAILLVGRSREVPVVIEGDIIPRLMMPLSLTYDHRLVDGAAAARFLNEVKSFLSAPGRLLLAP